MPSSHPNEFSSLAPPSNVKSEEAVVGNILREPGCRFEVIPTVVAASFTDAKARSAYEAIVALHAEGISFDLWAVEQRYRQMTQAEPGESVDYITGLFESAPSGANALYHAQIVTDMAKRRWAMQQALKLFQEAGECKAVDDLQARAQRIGEHLGRISGSHDPVPISEVMNEVFKAYDAAGSGLHTGLVDLDRYTTGFYPGQFIVIAGRPGQGKTSLAMTIAENMASGKHAVGYFSLEMGAAELGRNAIGRRTGISSRDMRAGVLSAQQVRDANDEAFKIGDLPLYIDDTTTLSVDSLRAKVRTLLMDRKIKIAFVDYLQLMDYGREREIDALTRITRGLKNLARDAGIPIVLLSQLSRAPEHGDDKRPRLIHLRGSGSIEQDADMVLMVYRPPNKDGTASNVAQILVEKQRNGPTGAFKLTFIPHKMKFENYAEQAEPGASSQRKFGWE